jgi:hypothetical protein
LEGDLNLKGDRDGIKEGVDKDEVEGVLQ